MSHLHVKYLLAGGGITSSAAAVAIRCLDSANSVLMIGQEINRPYHRPPLSKGYLRRQERHDDLFTLPPDWFDKNHVELRTGRRVAHLDTARSAATLDDGSEISYDNLLLATGASANRLTLPGASLPNIFYIRTIDDIERLGHAIDKAKAEGRTHARGRGRVAVIGGGILGVEMTGTLAMLGLGVDLVVGPKHPWHRFAGEPAGRYVARYLQRHGVNVHNSRRAARLEGDGRVQRIVLDNDQTIDCDFAIATVGTHVNREILRGTQIAAENAILVDERCRTSDEHVYAAGDCAAIFDPLFGKHRNIDHADNAVVTGTIAGTNMAGGDARYNAVSVYTTGAFELAATIWGEARLVDRRIVRGQTSGDPASFVEIGIAADGRIAQVLAIGQGHDSDALRKLVERRVQVNGNEEQLKDPNVPPPTFL